MLGMIAILGTWFIAHLVFVGIGSLVASAFKQDVSELDNYFLSFWVGWAVTIAFLQIWHFFFPVNDIVRTVTFTVGLLGYSRLLPQFKRVRSLSWSSLAMIVLLLLYAIWLSNQALVPNPDMDDGLYRLQVVRWVSEYPIVPGIGNLHDRLAFSNGYAYHAALFNISYWSGRVSHVAHGLLYVMLMGTCGLSIFQLVIVKQKHIYRMLNGLLTLIIALESMKDGVYSISNDAFTLIIGYVLASIIWRFIETITMVSKHSAAYYVIAATLLATVGITAKFSFIIFGTLGVGILIIIWMWEHHIRGLSILYQLAIVLLVACVVLVPMGLRSIIQTGYILYPITNFGGIDVKWRVPPERGENTVRWIAAWGRKPYTSPDEAMKNYEWLANWCAEFCSNRTFVQIPFGISALSFVSMLSILILRYGLGVGNWEIQGKTSLYYSLVAAIPIAALIFWFLTAPNPRFIGVSPYVLGLTLFGATLGLVPSKSWHSLAMVLASVLVYIVVANIASNPIIQPNERPGLYPQTIPSNMTVIEQSGIIFSVPDDGLCWGAELPCTNVWNKSLQLLEIGNLGSGFVVIKNE